jgi:excisionase family DNA binding protein
VTTASHEPLSEILTPEEVATILRVKPSWVHEKTRSRTRNPLPVLRIGRYIRFRRADVNAWLDRMGAPEKKGSRR